MKHLGTQFDIHVGGIDIKSTHHVNEIAQSEAATGKSPFVGYWVHGELLKVDGGRMGKSLGNAYSLEDIKKKNITPLALRYLYLSAHYRDTLNFTWQGLRAAEKGLERLKNQVAFCRQELGRTTLSVEKRKKVEEFQVRFASTLADDLNAPKALAVLWEVLKSNIPPGDKYELALSFDEVLGFGLRTVVLRKDFSIKIPSEIKTLVEKRDNLRRQNEFGKADKLRRKIEKHGYLIKDTKKGARLEKI